MLLTNGNLNVQQLLGGNVSGKKIAKIVVGTSDTPVTSADTIITDPVEKAVTGVNYLGGGVVQFTATLLSGDPAMTIKEVGLYDDDDVLCHRKVITPRVKSAGVSYVVNYNIKVQ
jgi:hypothetical protein